MKGKSDIVFQLAKRWEMQERRHCLDADIRKSAFIRRYGIEGEIKGLSQYLSGQVPVREVLYGTNYANLDMIFAGPVAPNIQLLEEDV